MHNKIKNRIPVLSMLIIIVMTAACTTSDNGGITQTLPVQKFRETLQNEHGVLIDVRSAAEYEEAHLEGAINFNVEDDHFKTQTDSLDKNKSYFLYCRSGKRSARAMEIMAKEGFKKLYNLDGGITEWRKNNMPVILKEELKSN
jgi:rhodanese-related sulfurtransferase